MFGIEVDTVRYQVRLPRDKLDQVKSEIKKVQNKKSATLLELQSLIGMLNFAYNVVLPGHDFLIRLINLKFGLKITLSPSIT